MGRKYLKRWRSIYRHLRRHRDSPETIARGIAAGVFAGCLPLFGLQMILAIGFASLMRGNRWIAAISTWISNPLTYVPLYAWNFHLGRWLINSHDDDFVPEDLTSLSQLVQYKSQLLVALLTGSLVMGCMTASFGYFLGLKLIRNLYRYR